MKPRKAKPLHRLIIRTKDNPYQWQLAEEVNLGSLTHPNKEIIEICFQPIRDKEGKWFE